MFSRRGTAALIFAIRLCATSLFAGAAASAFGAYTFSTLAGPGPGLIDGSTATARFSFPDGVAADAAGNVYVVDSNHNTVRKITPAGVVSTLAGTPGVSGSADGTGAAASFSFPSDVVVDSAGNLYVADLGNATIRKVTPAGVVTTLAGSAGEFGGDDGTGAAARFTNPAALAIDAAGNLYVADQVTNNIRKVTPAGVVTTIAGSGQYGSNDGNGTNAQFQIPGGIAIDAGGNLYVSDTGNFTIRKITPSGDVTTLAGNVGTPGSADGTGSNATFNSPGSLTVDSAGNVYVIDNGNQVIRKVTPAGAVTTFAGTAGLTGFVNGTGAAARFNGLADTFVGAGGVLYVADSGNGVIRKITPAAVVTTFAGAVRIGSADSFGTDARFSAPRRAALDSTGNLFVADSGNHTIRKITPDGMVSTFAGAAGQTGSTDATGTNARFNFPADVAIDATGNIFVADASNHCIRKITPAGVVTTFAGAANTPGFTDGTGTGAKFVSPRGLAIDGSGNLFAADGSAQTIRKITPAGVVTTIAGSPNSIGSSDGTGSDARFQSPRGIAVDGTGNLYVADTYNYTIRKIAPGGVVTTLAGSAGLSGYANGTGAAARFGLTQGIVIDGQDNLLVADESGSSIRKITPAGVVTTLAGGPNGRQGHVDGPEASAQFAFFSGLTLSSTGDLYVIDTRNHAIRKGSLNPLITAQSSPSFVFTGKNATFSVTAAGATGFQWQRSTDGGLTWTNLANDSTFSGATTATLLVGSVTGSMNGWKFRVVVSVTGGSGATSASMNLKTVARNTTPGLLWASIGQNADLLPRTSPQIVATGVTAVSSSGAHSAYIKSGFLLAMGNNSNHQVTSASVIQTAIPSQIASDVTAVSTGGYHTAFIKSDHTLWAVGRNVEGQLGDGSTTERSSPVQMASDVTAVSAGGNHTAFIKSDGTLWVTGNNDHGQLGDGTPSIRATPAQLASDVAAVSASANSTFFVKTDGTLWATGDNQLGQLGDGSTDNRPAPVQVASGVASVSSGGWVTLFVKTDGTLWGMGHNDGGQLGDGTQVDRHSPVQVATNVATAIAGSSRSFFIKTDGSVWAMGQASGGEFGNGIANDDVHITPFQVGSDMTSIVSGGSLRILSGGLLSAVSDNTYGQLGDRQQPAWPRLVGTDATTVGAEYLDDSLYVKSDGTVWETSTPNRQIPGVTGAVQVVNGSSGSAVPRLVLQEDGKLWELAADDSLTLVDSGVVSAAAGLSFVAYLKSDGTLWGRGNTAQIKFGDGTALTQVADHVTFLSTSWWHILFIKDDNTLWGMGTAWGGLAPGGTLAQYVNAPAQLETGVVWADAHPEQNLYLKTDGTLWTRGNGWANWTGPAVQVDSDVTTAVAASNYGFTLGGFPQGTYYLKSDGILRHREGVTGTLGSVTQIASNVVSIAGGSYTRGVFFTQSTTQGPGPVITTQPQSATLAPGALYLSLQVVASGPGPFAYQWYRNGVALPLGKAFRYSLPYAQAGDAGTYTVRVTSREGSVMSSPATISVTGVTPVINALTPLQVIAAGQNAVFSASATGATTYQWQHSIDGGATWTDVTNGGSFAGATTATLTVSGGTAGMNGWNFRVVAGNGTDSVTSAATLLALTTTNSTPGFLWGQDRDTYALRPQTAPRAVAGNVASASLNQYNNYFLKTDGTLWVAGDNGGGITGNSVYGSAPHSVPVQVASGVASVSAALDHVMFIKNDGTLWGAGLNIFGALGDGTNTPRTTPVQVASNVTAVSCGSFYTMFVKVDGTLWAAGANFSGRLGDGTYDNRYTPVQVATGVASVATGYTHTLFVKNDGTLWGMGESASGELLSNSYSQQLTPVQVATSVVSAAASYQGVTLYITSDGTLWGRGMNPFGGLGDPAVSVRRDPVALATGVTKAVIGSQFTLFIKNDGSLWSMGSNSNGQLGIGTVDGNAHGVPQQIATGVASISAGPASAEFVTTTGVLMTMGDDTTGLLGDGQVPPVPALLSSDVRSAAGGNLDRTFYIKSDGQIWSQETGQPVAAAGTGNVQAATDSLGYLSLYLKGDGALWLVSGNGTDTVSHNQVASNVVSAGTGGYGAYYVYLKSDGTLWGVGQYGVLKYGDGIAPSQVADHVTSFSTKGPLLLFVKDNQTLWGMGDTVGGLVPGSASSVTASTPVQLDTNVVSATAWAQRNLTLKSDGTLWLRRSGWSSQSAAPVLVDSGAVSMAPGSDRIYYTKANGILYSRLDNASVPSLGDVVELAGGIISITSGVGGLGSNTIAGDGWISYLQAAGFGTPPSISAHPQSQGVGGGAAVTLSVTATGTGPLAYRWLKNGVTISTARTAQYNIPFALADDSGTYAVTVTNSAGSVTSQAAVLAVGAGLAPTFSAHPQGATIVRGTSVTFTAAATGAPVPTYQWKKNGAAIPGATGASYTIASVQDGDAGSYTVVATNDAGSATSNAATLTVIAPAAAGDLDGDGQADLIWQNRITGERSFWLMNGTAFGTGFAFWTVDPSWQIVGTGDFDGDGQNDLVWTNTLTGERSIWLMNGTTFRSGISLNSVPLDWQIAAIGDFNIDGKSDLVWQNLRTGECSIWLMNGGNFTGVPLNTVPPEWQIVSSGDFNADGKADLVWTNTATGERAIWLMNGTAFGSGVSLGSIPKVWQIVGSGDFNADGQSDLVWTNISTGERTIWLMDGTTHTSTVAVGTVTVDWILGRTQAVPAPVQSDFNADGNSDLIWQNLTTGERSLWVMNGTSFSSGVNLSTIPTAWQIVASGDFNADGKSDIVWANTTTGERSFWLMNGTTFNYGIGLGTIPTNWQIVASGDYNGDGKSDLVWSNTTTGERSIWLMNGTSYMTGAALSTVPTNWQIVASGDFNADGKSDLVWTDTSTGERSIWFMDGTAFSSGVSLGIVPLNLQIVGTGDFNADGKSDLVWTNTATGERTIWLMDGVTHSSTASLGFIPTQWTIRN